MADPFSKKCSQDFDEHAGRTNRTWRKIPKISVTFHRSFRLDILVRRIRSGKEVEKDESRSAQSEKGRAE